MTEKTPTNNIEMELSAIYQNVPVSDSFVNSLKFQLNSKNRIQPTKRVQPLHLRPVWVALIFCFVALIATTLIIGPARVYAEVRRWLGYIPGVGLVETETPVRVLAEVVEQTRDGVTISVTSATLSGDKTHLEYRVFGVPRSAYPDDESVMGCSENEYLELPDGTQLPRSDDYPAIPLEVNQAVLVIPCITNALPGLAPEDWRIPLRFIEAPSNLTVLPVIEVTPSEIAQPGVSTEPVPAVVDQSISVTQMIETETGYILIGRFDPGAQVGEWVQTTGMPVLRDASGEEVPYTIPVDVDPGGSDLQNGGFGWVYQFDAAGLSFPLELTFTGVTISQPDPTASAEIVFDAGQTITPGQEWRLDQSVLLAGHSIKLETITAIGQEGYAFTFAVDPRVNAFSVQIADHEAAGGGGGGLVNGRITTSLTFSTMPTGVLTLKLSNLTEMSSPQTWQGTWSPAEVRTDLPEVEELPAGTCANAHTLESISNLPEGIDGTILVYEKLPENDQWGLVLYNLDGSGRRVISSEANWGALSADGNFVLFAAQDGFSIFEIATGEIENVIELGGYNPIWSTDGTRFAYVNSNSSGVSITDISTGTNNEVSSVGYETVIGWLPDDSRLIIAAMYSGGVARQVRSVDTLTGEYDDLFVIEDASVKGLNATLSPDGEKIAYRDRDNSSVHLVNLDGSDSRLLLDSPAAGTSGIVWDRKGWIGISLVTTGGDSQQLILANPETCEVYKIPSVTGTIQGLHLN